MTPSQRDSFVILVVGVVTLFVAILVLGFGAMVSSGLQEGQAKSLVTPTSPAVTPLPERPPAPTSTPRAGAPPPLPGQDDAPIPTIDLPGTATEEATAEPTPTERFATPIQSGSPSPTSPPLGVTPQTTATLPPGVTPSPTLRLPSATTTIPAASTATTSIPSPTRESSPTTAVPTPTLEQPAPTETPQDYPAPTATTDPYP